MGGFQAVQIAFLARRSIMRTLREPMVLFPSLIFPLAFFAVLAGGVSAAGELPGFPARSYTDFALTIPLFQGALLGSVSSATDLARDIETGFLDRLLLTPVRNIAILAGHLIGVVVLACVQVAVFLNVGLAFGVRVESGVTGVLVIALLAILLAVGVGGFGALVALRTGSAEAVQGIFPLTFALMFLSSLMIPRDLIETDWFRIVATVNPASYLIEGIRSLIITGWDAEALALGFSVAAGGAVLGLSVAAMALRGRAVRT